MVFHFHWYYYKNTQSFQLPIDFAPFSLGWLRFFLPFWFIKEMFLYGDQLQILVFNLFYVFLLFSISYLLTSLSSVLVVFIFIGDFFLHSVFRFPSSLSTPFPFLLQVLNHWAISPALFYFWDRVMLSCPVWAWTCDPTASQPPK